MDAAMALFDEQGYSAVTAVQIAERAGVTTRTFFRHFPDKPAVLFVDANRLRAVLVSAVETDTTAESPLEVVMGALARFDWLALGSRGVQHRRYAMIASHQELLERELVKQYEMAAEFSAALQRRGTAAPVADLAAQIGVAVFRTAYRAWLTDAHDLDFTAAVTAAMAHLVDMTPNRTEDAPVTPES